MYPIGETKIIKISLAAGETNSLYRLQPPPGYEWILNFLYAWQNNVNDSTMEWFLYSAEKDYSISMGAVSPATTYQKVWFRPGDDQDAFNFGFPMRFNWDCFPLATCGALEADKLMEIFGMIIERPANLELTLADWFAHMVGHKLPAGLEGMKYRIEHYRGGI